MPLLAALQLAAVELRRLPAEEARQGAAASADSVYAVDNSRIVRFDKASRARMAAWNGDPARFPHVNSCAVRGPELVCAASNYPATPMTSRVLWFDARTLKLRRERDLGRAHGSLTWLDWRDGGWWAGFAHYDGEGGEPGRDHRFTTLTRYTPGFRTVATWRFPDTVLARFAPRSVSGGAWARDGLLYVTGHDRPELYALRVPAAGGVLEHVATIATPTGGQAIGWDPRDPRLLWSVDRRARALVASRIPKAAR